MNEKLAKHTLLLRDGDFEFLKAHFPKKGASAIIRQITSDLVDKLDRPVNEEELEELE